MKNNRNKLTLNPQLFLVVVSLGNCLLAMNHNKRPLSLDITTPEETAAKKLKKDSTSNAATPVPTASQQNNFTVVPANGVSATGYITAHVHTQRDNLSNPNSIILNTSSSSSSSSSCNSRNLSSLNSSLIPKPSSSSSSSSSAPTEASMFISTSGKFEVVETELQNTDPKSLVSSAKNITDSRKKEAMRVNTGLKERIMRKLITKFDALIKQEDFDSEQITEIETAYSTDIKKELAQIITAKYAGDLNKITKPGIETAFLTGIAPAFTKHDTGQPTRESQQFDQLLGTHFDFDQTGFWKAKKLLGKLDLTITSFTLLNRSEKNKAQNLVLIHATTGMLYLYNKDNLILQEITTIDPTVSVTETYFDEQYNKIAVVTLSPTKHIDVYIFDLSCCLKTQLQIQNIDSPVKNVSLIAKSTFCLLELENKKTVAVRLETGASCTVDGIMSMSDPDGSEDNNQNLDIASAIYVGYVHRKTLQLTDFPQFDPHVAKTQYPVIYIGKTAFSRQAYTVFNHDQTTALKKDKDQQLFIHNLQQGTIEPLGMHNVDDKISHFDFHEKTKQLILIAQNPQHSAPYLVLYNLKDMSVPIIYALPKEPENITSILFNLDATQCIISHYAQKENQVQIKKVSSIDLKTKKVTELEGILCGKPNSDHAVVFDQLSQNDSQPHVNILPFATQKIRELTRFNLLELYCARESEQAEYCNTIATPNGKYVITTYGTTNESTLVNTIFRWKISNSARQTFRPVHKEQDSFLKDLVCYNDKYIIGVCNKGYVYIGDIETCTLHQLLRSRELPNGNIAARIRAEKIACSADKKYVYMQAETEYFDKYTSDGDPDVNEFTDETISNFDLHNFERIFDLEHANFAFAASTLSLPQLLICIRLLQKNQYFQASYQPLFTELSPLLQTILRNYIIKKTISKRLTTLDLAQLATEYAAEREEHDSSKSEDNSDSEKNEFDEKADN